MFAVLLSMVLTGIYLFVDHSRVETFFNKLDERAITVAQFYLAEDNLSKENFKKVLNKFPQSLSEETIRIYNEHYEPQFIREDSIRWNIGILKKVAIQKRMHFTQGNRQVTGIYYIDNSGRFIIIVSAVDVNGNRDISELAWIMSFFFLASLIITFFMGSVFSRVALLPIVKMTSNLKRIRSTSLDLRLPIDQKKTDEIDSLSLTINRLLEHLEQSFESQRSFIANASHELRTPITTILGEAEITLMSDRQMSDYQLVLRNIIKETERLSYIINSLMDLIQTNTDNYAFQDIRIDELLWELEDELSDADGGKRVSITSNLPNDLENYTLQGNRQLLFIAINNILKNALKFSDDKPVTCEINFDIKHVHIRIRDLGIGIEDEDIDKIFQPFYRSTNAICYPGYGIGLSLTQNIIKLHDGTINIESQPGKGSVFHVVLPFIT